MIGAGRGDQGQSEGIVETLFLLVGSAVLFWLAVRAGFRISDQTISMLVRGFRSWSNEDWPRGVQEEDRDRPWGRGSREATTTAHVPKLTRVHGVVRPR
jgi:hypothetical protein